MKRLLSLPLFIFLICNSFGQITLQQTDMASPGDQIENISPPFDGDVPPPGAAQTYNFMIDSAGFADTSYFVAASATPFAAQMAGANLASIQQGAYTYYEKDGTGFYLRGLVFDLSALGVGGISLLPLRFNPRVPVLTFPATVGMNAKVQSTARFRFPFDTVVTVLGQNATVDSVEVTATLRDTSTIDGYGTAEFPSGNLATLRNRQAQNLSFSIRVRAKIGILPAFWTAFPLPGLPTIYGVSYLFWANGKKGPVATLDVDSFGVVTNATFQAQLLSLNTGVSGLAINWGGELFPNPASDVISWSNAGMKKIEIFSVSGKKVFEKPIEPGYQSLSVSDINAGIYISILEDFAGNRYRNKLIIRR